jgi:4-hydroxy-tetrahydrodipicolinate synthase
MNIDWRGVYAAITTPFTEKLGVDLPVLRRQVSWLVDEGCNGLVPLGSLGEASTLNADEKAIILDTILDEVGGRVPIVAGIAGLSTQEACTLAKVAEKAGCAGLMVLPPYVYRGDDREMEYHFEAVIGATALPCMLYNNPIAYGTDTLPERVEYLVRRHPNLVAIKESSTDVRRVTALKRLLGERLAIFCGVDDLIVEALEAGAIGWIAGLVDALPAESVRLYEHAIRGERKEAMELYDWFLPLLRLDTVPKFIQLIKLVQAEIGIGSARVRPPRLELEGAELHEALCLIRAALGDRPKLPQPA